MDVKFGLGQAGDEVGLSDLEGSGPAERGRLMWTNSSARAKPAARGPAGAPQYWAWLATLALWSGL